jgi:hypothetical protein
VIESRSQAIADVGAPVGNNPAVSTANTPAFVAKHTPLYLDSVNHRQA